MTTLIYNRSESGTFTAGTAITLKANLRVPADICSRNEAGVTVTVEVTGHHPLQVEAALRDVEELYRKGCLA